MTLEIRKQPSYYTLTPRQEVIGAALERPIYPDKPRHFNTLVQRCLAPFQQNEEQADKKVRVEERIQVFNNGDRPLPVTDKAHRTVFTDEAARIVGQFCHDLIQPDGNLVPDREQEWFNLMDIAPKLIEIMTDRDNHISLVQQPQALNIVTSALYLARNPNANAVIRVGFGGSDDPYTSSRLPAYSIPALKIAEKIRNFYEDRKMSKLHRVALQKKATELEQKLERPLSKEEKAILAQELTPDQDGHYQILDPEEEQAFLDMYSIPKSLPKIEFFFAYQAAIAINQTMDPEQIQKRAHENIRAVRDYVLTYHPRVASQVSFQEDIPWNQHRPHSKIILQYLAHLLRTSEDRSIQETLATLQNLGSNHGGQNGAEQAAEYAAIHPWGFGDRLNIPYVNYIKDRHDNNEINITIGGKPERHFCSVRTFLSQRANPDGLIDFIDTRINESGLDDREKAELIKTLSVVKRWRKITDASRQKAYIKDDESQWNRIGSIRADTPQVGISLITSIGEKPTYYATEYDSPIDADPDEYDRFLQDQAQYFINTPPSDKIGAMRRLTLKGVLFDIAALRKDQGKEFSLPKIGV